MKINENEKILRKFKKKIDFNDLNAAIKKSDDYKSIKYKMNEKKIQKKDKTVENFIIIDE